MKYIIIGVLFSFIYSCNNNVTNTNQTSKSYEKVSFKLLFKEYNKTFKLPNNGEIFIAQNQEDYLKTVGVLNLTRMPPLVFPKVNFEENSVLIIKYKIKNTDKNDVEIEEIKHTKEELKIFVNEVQKPLPAPSAAYTDLLLIIETSKVKANHANTQILLK